MQSRQTIELSEEEKQRYARQMIIPNWGEETQRRLKASKVFIAGAGGAGQPGVIQPGRRGNRPHPDL